MWTYKRKADKKLCQEIGFLDGCFKVSIIKEILKKEEITQMNTVGELK